VQVFFPVPFAAGAFFFVLVFFVLVFASAMERAR
jgi:hypothetical protein